jgi:hypothetical protein
MWSLTSKLERYADEGMTLLRDIVRLLKEIRTILKDEKEKK